SRRPLGLVIVGGLIFSQMVTLFVTPVIYLWLEWFQEHVLDKVPFLRSAHYHEHGEPARGGIPTEPAVVRWFFSLALVRAVKNDEERIVQCPRKSDDETRRSVTQRW